MSAATVIVVSDLITVVLALGGSMISFGFKFGEVRTDIRTIKDRLDRIEKLFRMRLKQK